MGMAEKRAGIRLVSDPSLWWCRIPGGDTLWEAPDEDPPRGFASTNRLTWPADRELRWCRDLPLVVVVRVGVEDVEAALCWAMDAEGGTPIDESIDSRVRIGAREDTETPGRVAWATESGDVVARVEVVDD